MDLANSLTSWRALTSWRNQTPEQWIRSANRVLPPLVVGILVVAIAYRLAELTVALLPHQAFDRPPPQIVQPSPSAETGSAANFSALQDSHLFGEANAAAPAPVEPVNTEVDAPDTTLPLTLSGVTVDAMGKKSQAHILSGRTEEHWYAVGDEIENANGVKLHAVFSDRVILNRGGQLETLRFDDNRRPVASAGRIAPPPPPPAQFEEESFAVEDDSLRSAVTANSASLTDVFRMAPHIEGGQMVGFRLNPGRDRQTFDALGLMPGDVVTDINGVVLDDPGKALQIFDTLGEATQASVTVMRDGVPSVIVIDTTQIQSLIDDRQ